MPYKDPAQAKAYDQEKYKRKQARLKSDVAFRLSEKLRNKRIKAKYHSIHKIRLNRETRETRLLQTYGITEEQYKTRCEEQQNKCAICKQKTDKLCVDHKHGNKGARGLVCMKCNLGLGLFKDNPAWLRNAALYLESEYWVIK